MPEKELYGVFRDSQVNKVNSRKAFFRVLLSEIKSKVNEMNLNSAKRLIGLVDDGSSGMWRESSDI